MSEPRRLSSATARVTQEVSSLARWLRECSATTASVLTDPSRGYVDGPSEPVGAILILIGSDGEAVAYWHNTTKRQLRRADAAIRERTEPEGSRPSDYHADHAAARAAEAAAKPYPCTRKGGCGLRFPTERGRVSHEQAAERAAKAQVLIEAERPSHAERGCYFGRGGSCGCGLRPANYRGPLRDWRHEHLIEPVTRPYLQPVALP